MQSRQSGWRSRWRAPCTSRQHRRDLHIVFGLFGTFVDQIVGVAEIDRSGSLVKQRSCGGEFGLHLRQHLIDRREFVDALLELHALGGVFSGLAVGSLRNAERLSADGNACAVHQAHHILNQSEALLAAEFRGDIVVLKLGGRHAVNPKLVLDTADFQFRAGFTDEHGKSASVGCSSPANGQAPGGSVRSRW